MARARMADVVSRKRVMHPRQLLTLSCGKPYRSAFISATTAVARALTPRTHAVLNRLCQAAQARRAAPSRPQEAPTSSRVRRPVRFACPCPPHEIMAPRTRSKSTARIVAASKTPRTAAGARRAATSSCRKGAPLRADTKPGDSPCARRETETPTVRVTN